MPTVSVIIVNFNGEKLLDDCLLSLKAQTYRDFEVIFVDNGSSDRSVPRTRELFPDARILAMNENTGFAKGNNIGIEAAGGKYIVLLNNDTKADARFLEILVQTVERDERVGMVAPKILNFFDRTIDSVGGLLFCRDGLAQGQGRGEADRGQYDYLQEALVPSGCAALYRRDMLSEIGLFDESFFAYCEDSDLGLRGVWAGWKAAAAPGAVVFHKYSATTSAYSPFKLFLVERNHYFVVLKNFPLCQLPLIPLWSAWRFLLMACAVLRGKGKGKAATGSLMALLGVFLRGHWRMLLGAAGMLRRRPVIRRISGVEFAQRLKQFRLPLARMVLND
jgi:GT2 family glycosyltransferase